MRAFVATRLFLSLVWTAATLSSPQPPQQNISTDEVASEDIGNGVGSGWGGTINSTLEDPVLFPFDEDEPIESTVGGFKNIRFFPPKIQRLLAPLMHEIEDTWVDNRVPTVVKEHRLFVKGYTDFATSRASVDNATISTHLQITKLCDMSAGGELIHGWFPEGKVPMKEALATSVDRKNKTLDMDAGDNEVADLLRSLKLSKERLLELQPLLSRLGRLEFTGLNSSAIYEVVELVSQGSCSDSIAVALGFGKVGPNVLSVRFEVMGIVVLEHDFDLTETDVSRLCIPVPIVFGSFDILLCFQGPIIYEPWDISVNGTVVGTAPFNIRVGIRFSFGPLLFGIPLLVKVSPFIVLHPLVPFEASIISREDMKKVELMGAAARDLEDGNITSVADDDEEEEEEDDEEDDDDGSSALNAVATAIAERHSDSASPRFRSLKHTVVPQHSHPGQRPATVFLKGLLPRHNARHQHHHHHHHHQHQLHQQQQLGMEAAATSELQREYQAEMRKRASSRSAEQY